MSVELLKSEGRSVVRLTEAIGLGSAAELHKLLLDAIGSNASIGIHLEGVTELDVSGIQLLCAVRQAGERAGITVSLEGAVPAAVRGAFLAAGLDPFHLADGPEVR